MVGGTSALNCGAMALVPPAARGSHHRRNLHLVSHCPIAGIALRTGRHSSPGSGRSGIVRGEGGGLPNRRPRIFPVVYQGDRPLHLTQRSELGGKCAREVAYRLPGLLGLLARHEQQLRGPHVRQAEEINLHNGEVCRERGN